MKYNQPFYVPIGKGKLNLHTSIRGGYYLPALVSPELEDIGQNIPQEIPWTRQQWDEVKQLKAQILHLSSKVNEMRAAAPKEKPKKQPAKELKAIEL